MHTIFLSGALCVFLLLSRDVAVAAAANSDQEAIRATISNYMKARNEKTPERLAQLFTADADQLVSTGEWRHGADELVRGMTASSRQEQAKSSVSITDIRMLDQDVAIVDGGYQTTSLEGTVREMWTTFVVKRTPDAWRIAAIRNMKPTSRERNN